MNLIEPVERPERNETERPERPERSETDTSLRVERDKTDQTLVENHAATERAADDTVQVARDRADAVLSVARSEADRQLADAGATSGVRQQAARERTRAAGVLEKERSTEDAALAAEREAFRRTINEFLQAERDETDDHLILERERADRAIASRDDFLGMVSHDLRSLLSGIAMNSAMLTKAAPADEAGTHIRECAARNQRFVARMYRLIRDLLDITSIEAGKLLVMPERLDAHRLVSEAAETFQPLATARGIVVDVQTTGDPLLAEFDHERLLQVLGNLLDNALKFTPTGGRISLRAALADSAVEFAVSDTGAGIAEEDLKTVFDRFRQVNRRDRRGLGLGLYIARCIVEAHGGKMWVESQVGMGTTFHFTIPVSAKATE